ncbi:MAG: GDYXXLXY domain-containing protein [Candidatus Erginobacter occultus]|nr:GDYXXLXY domain-containing protein [Candidatus Erginobacter occultus]
MKKTWIFIAFAALAILQIGVCAARIIKWEDILRTGTQIRLRTTPVDPYDAFRGRYIALDFEEETVPAELGPDLQWGDEVYAVFREDEAGFARIDELRKDQPAEGNYLRIKVSYRNRDKGQIRLKFPFRRFYLKEDLAPAAEKAYLTGSREEKRTASVTVRLKNGYGVLEDLMIEDQPIAEFIRAKRKKEKPAAAPSPKPPQATNQPPESTSSLEEDHPASPIPLGPKG